MDSIVLAYLPPFRVPSDCWLDVRLDLQERLESPVLLLDMSLPTDELEQIARSHWDLCCERKVDRVGLITVDCAEQSIALIELARLWRKLKSSEESKTPALFIAQRWDSSDWAEFLVSGNLGKSTSRWLILAKSFVASQERLNLGFYSQQRKQITELVWELRRLGTQVDFEFEDSRSMVQASDNHVEIPWGTEWMLDAPTLGTNKVDRVILTQGEACVSKAFSEVFPLTRIVPLLVNKYLGAFEYEAPTPNAMGSIDLGHESFVRRMNAMIPAEYRGRMDEIQTDSMGSATIHLDADGNVPWDKIWTSFCDLGLAGGPPHRGRLLEPVDRDKIELDIAAYSNVVAEIRRGIYLVSGLATIESDALGWVGLVCEDQPMAAWMLRAIIAENVIARRQNNVIFIPAGPRFTIYKEIKNLIVTIAKTTHFYRL